MKKNLLLLVTLICALSCSSSTESSLQKSIDSYVKSWVEQDYIGMSIYVVPSLIEEMGGIEGFIASMEQLDEVFEQQGMKLKVSEYELETTSSPITFEEIIVTVATSTLPFTMNGEEGAIYSSIFCFSEDQGDTWFFLEASDEGRAQMASMSPKLLQKLTIPQPRMKLGSKVMVQKNGSWAEE
ncbi:hypothetical protein N9C81_02030 [Planctomycetota bacterium]|nr:hypothetical protein [Planctomycetota bacterium]